MSAAPGFFEPRHAESLLAFANQAAVAIENARLYQELETYSDILMEAIERRTTEIQRTKERVEVILSNSPDVILVLNSSFLIQTGNAAFTALFGHEVERVINQPLETLVIPEHRVDLHRLLEGIEIGEEGGRGEFVIKRLDGTEVDVDVALSPHIFEGTLEGVICSFRDISALKEVERMKDRFVSNVSHELRTPITSLKLFLGLLESTPSDASDYDELLQTLKRETDRIHYIVEDVLNLSRLDQKRIEVAFSPVNLNRLFERYLMDRAILAKERNIRLEFLPESALPAVVSDERLVGQVFAALLANAINYTPVGGIVTVRTLFHPSQPDRWCGFSISDTGPGVKVEEQEKIFERFYRGRTGRDSGAPGTGLGLAIAREILKRLHGAVELESSGIPGEGTTFRVWLPIEPATSAVSPSLQAGQAAS